MPNRRPPTRSGLPCGFPGGAQGRRDFSILVCSPFVGGRAGFCAGADCDAEFESGEGNLLAGFFLRGGHVGKGGKKIVTRPLFRCHKFLFIPLSRDAHNDFQDWQTRAGVVVLTMLAAAMMTELEGVEAASIFMRPALGNVTRTRFDDGAARQARLAGVGVARHPLDCLAARQLTLTGIYRWL